MSDDCTIKDCQICRDATFLGAIAAKCTTEERRYLNELYGRMAAAETEIEYRDLVAREAAQTVKDPAGA